MTSPEDTICITSYNSTGFGLGAQNFICDLLLFSNILCIQEHFLQDCGDRKHSNTNKIRRVLGDGYDLYINPAFKEGNQVNKGRAKGGLATIWHKSLTKYASKVKCDNFRVQATKFSFPGGKLLVLNTYFPCDPRRQDFDDNELLKTFADITNIIKSNDCDNVLVLGDLNCDLARSTSFVDSVKMFFDDLSFKFFWENPSDKIQAVNYTYAQSVNNVISYSKIDHFVSNQRVINAVTEAGVVHQASNTSNHSPIFAKIKVGELNTSLENATSNKRTKWDSASEEAKEKYRATVANNLKLLETPTCITCLNPHCTQHSEDLEKYAMDVLETVETCAKDSLPTVGGGGGQGKHGGGRASHHSHIAGWSEYVKPFCDESKFWHAIWMSAGRPSTGHLFDMMMHTKRQFKYAVRRLKRAEDKIQNDKFVQGILGGGVNIFTEIKKFRGNVKQCSSVIDNEVGGSNIANLFAGIYSKLYNQKDYGQEISDLWGQLDKDISATNMSDAESINEDLIQEALRKMKGNKNDAVFDFQSDCLTSGPPELVKHLTNLIRAFIIHGQVPYFLLVCTLIPLVKDNLGDLTSSDNYRAIASSCQILKLLDIVVLLLDGDKLKCDSLQFGFQPKSSTSMCSWSVTAVINHYNGQGTDVYGCAMDLSKAFDLVEWLELFRTLRKRKLSPLLLRVLLYVYSHQACDVRWNGKHSFKFPVTNGVRQGAVSSPILFSVYIDSLFQVLRSSGLGCKVGGVFLGCFGYADDLLLLSTSRTGLQVMVKMCEDFAVAKSLKFSTHSNPEKSKTKCILFTNKRRSNIEVQPVLLNSDPLPWVTDLKHLGNILETDNSMKKDCSLKRSKFIGKLSSLQQEFHSVAPHVFVKILNIYAVSFYGSGLWDVYSGDCDRFYKAWNVCMRIVFKLDRTTHRYLIETISNSLHPKVMLASRYIKFHEALKKSDKLGVRILATICENDQRTVLGKTLTKISDDCRCSREELTANLVKKTMKYFPVPADEQWRTSIAEELSNVDLTVPGFSEVELEQILTYICTT